MPLALTDVEVRILGCLMEKESTTPDAYPLSLNSLVSACNQTSNRDPVMALGEDAVKWAINNLRQKSLVRAVQHSDSRVMRFKHLMAETEDRTPPELAVMCVLMLRGPQTTGELKGRTQRLSEFASIADVDATLNGLVAQELVVALPRRPGQKESRWAHLLSGPVSAEPTESAEAPVPSASAGDERIAALEAAVGDLRNDLSELRERFEAFIRQFG